MREKLNAMRCEKKAKDESRGRGGSGGSGGSGKVYEEATFWLKQNNVERCFRCSFYLRPLMSLANCHKEALCTRWNYENGSVSVTWAALMLAVGDLREERKPWGNVFMWRWEFCKYLLLLRNCKKSSLKQQQQCATYSLLYAAKFRTE